MGVEQTIINGRRVTDDATLEMAKMIFAGKINTDILAALCAAAASRPSGCQALTATSCMRSGVRRKRF